MSPPDAAPTVRQLSYLRVLALRTATTFAYPTTRSQASRQIDSLRRLQYEPPSSDVPTHVQEGEQLLYATAVRECEVSGYGASARWRTRPAARVTTGVAGGPGRGSRELARYRIGSGERVLRAERLDGSLAIIDRPADGSGRAYTVEPDIGSDAPPALKALIADYVCRARELDTVPMAASAVAALFSEVNADA